MKLLLALTSLASVAFASITFNVVGYPSANTNTFGVSIAGTVHKMNSSDSTFPVWTTFVAGTTSAVEYSYVELSSADVPVKTEPFVRKMHNLTETQTLNEFFERPTTVWELPKLPYTYLATYPSKTKAFKQKQIATIHITAPVAQMAEMHANPKAERDYFVDFRFINSKTIHSVRNITLRTSGKSSKDFSKQAFKLKFDTQLNQTFFSRPNIKLRSMVQDPTMMREKLYIDVLNSVGIPTQQGAWVRLYVNSIPYGLFLMVDDIKKSFLKQTVHAGNPSVLPGSLVQMNAYTSAADLIYKGPTTADYDPFSYESENLGTNPELDPLKELISFMSDLQAFNGATTPNAVEYWNNTRLELDGFLRNMACEYLMGAFDTYWYSGSNYFMYKNPTLAPGGKWQWLPTDFDNTFGSGYPTGTPPSYKTYGDFAVRGDKPLVSKLIIQNPQINAMFEQIVKEIVSTVLKPEAILPRAKAYNQMLSLDAKWDISLTRLSVGKNNNFTFDDFNNNLYNNTKDMQTGIMSWIERMNAVVTKDLAFTIPAGLADRVPPPPKKGDQGNPEDEEDDDPNTKPNEESKGSGGSTSAASFLASNSWVSQGVLAFLAAGIAMAL